MNEIDNNAINNTAQYSTIINNFNLINTSIIEPISTVDIDVNNNIDVDNDININNDNYNDDDIDIDDISNEDINNLQKQNIDPWDDSINDNHFILTNKIMRIFPHLKNSNNYLKLMIDDESLTYITIREIAELTSKIICHHLIKYNLNPQKIKIIDYTAGVGGNVLSFGKFFNKVYAIEIHKNRFEYLKNNIDVYEYKNILCINDSSINFNDKFLVDVNPNVIFIDPPWGGNNYRETESLRLKLDNVPIEDLVIDIFSKLYEHTIKNDICSVEINNKKVYKQNIFHNKFIVLKLPKNYDIEYFYETIKINNNIPNHTIYSYLYILNKMLIVVCEFFSIAD